MSTNRNVGSVLIEIKVNVRFEKKKVKDNLVLKVECIIDTYNIADIRKKKRVVGIFAKPIVENKLI